MLRLVFTPHVCRVRRPVPGKVESGVPVACSLARHASRRREAGAYHDKAGWTGAEHKAPHPDLLPYPDLPQTVKMAYIRCPARPYIPKLLRCFQCQRYGPLKERLLGPAYALVAGNRATTAQIVKKKEQCLKL
ncbi:hypothetical protein TNCV_1696411 [Trichonephila clavipes]|nr:hypothetical protein TNCV_1696411 [Trichonephila clavipes]